MHRLGTGLVLWMIMQPAFGRRAAWIVLLAMAVLTVVGYYFSAAVLPLAGQRGVVMIEALIVGAIVHSLVHREHVSRHGAQRH